MLLTATSVVFVYQDDITEHTLIKELHAERLPLFHERYRDNNFVTNLGKWAFNPKRRILGLFDRPVWVLTQYCSLFCLILCTIGNQIISNPMSDFPCIDTNLFVSGSFSDVNKESRPVEHFKDGFKPKSALITKNPGTSYKMWRIQWVCVTTYYVLF